MITHEEALELLRRHARPMGEEELPTAQCNGRYLARDISARLASPPFDKSAMDGYAARQADLTASPLPLDLDLIGESIAGRWPDFTIGPGQCSVITTGAPVPDGADTVIMIEHTQKLPGGKVRVEKLSTRNICRQAEDIALGQIVRRAGQRLTPLCLGVASSVGHGRLTIHRRPSIALLCTGAEIIDPPAPLEPGQIYNSNGPVLTALLEPQAHAFHNLGIVPDTPEATRAAIAQGLDHDFLVLTGGVSVGPYDLVPDALRDMGVKVIFHKCAIKPGKPTLFGIHNKNGRQSYVFGLPGNPQSGFAIYHILMRPLLALLSGHPADAPLPPLIRGGVMNEGFSNKPERKNFIPCRVTPSSPPRIDLVSWRGSADIMGTSAANAFLIVPRGVTQVQAGEIMEYFHF